MPRHADKRYDNSHLDQYRAGFERAYPNKSLGFKKADVKQHGHAWWVIIDRDRGERPMQREEIVEAALLLSSRGVKDHRFHSNSYRLDHIAAMA